MKPRCLKISRLGAGAPEELGYYETQTLLMTAAKSKKPSKVLRTILELRAEVNALSSNGTNAMFIARSPAQALGQRPLRQRPALWRQVWLLLEARADVHVRRGDMMLTPLTGCATMACTETVRALLQARCSPQDDIHIPIL